MMNLRFDGILRGRMRVVWSMEDKLACIRMHPALAENEDESMARVVAVRHGAGGAVMYLVEGSEDGGFEAEVYVAGKMPKSAYLSIGSIGWFLGIKRLFVRHDRRMIKLLCERCGWTSMGGDYVWEYSDG